MAWSTTLAAVVAACGAPAPGPLGPSDAPQLRSGFAVVAEGPCSRLTVQAVGRRRLLVYGETGYDLRGWLPGDELAAAQSVVELRGDRVLRNLSLLRGLPAGPGGYVPGELTFGGDFERRAWLLVGTTRYAELAAGALFERTVTGFEYHRGVGWRPAAGPPAEMPPAASALPPLDRGALCRRAGLRFVPLASAATPAGGLFVAGRCDDEAPVNYRDTTVLIAHGRPRATAWRVKRAPDTDALDGIVNLDLYAPGDDDAYLVAYEPFRAVAERTGYLARYDGERWRSLDAPAGGLMSVAGTGDGALWLAAGSALYRRQPDGTTEEIALPPLRHARSRAPQPGELWHLHTVHAFADGDVWVEGSYRVGRRRPGTSDLEPVWASALWSNRPLRSPVYCEAQEPAADALSEVD